jgi:hypothetical protein
MEQSPPSGAQSYSANHSISLILSNPKFCYGVHKEVAICLHHEPEKLSPLLFYLHKINFNVIPIYG